MSNLRADLRCQCGATVEVSASDAGGTVVCKCGQSIAVPSLSRLRTIAGTDAYVTNPVEAIRKAQNYGNDPAGNVCVMCGSTDPTVYRFTALCEQSHAKRADEDGNVIIRWLLLPTIYNLLLWFHQRPTETDRQGHDIEVSFNLPVCRHCSATIGDVQRSGVAKKLMQRVPLYRELLEYYPSLSLEVERTMSSGI